MEIKTNELKKSYQALKEQAEQSADSFYQLSMQLVGQRLDEDLKIREAQFNEAEKAAEDEYLNTLQDCANSFQEQIVQKKNELLEVHTELDNFKKKLNAAAEQARRQEELENQLDFHRVILSPKDEEEIKAFLSIENLIHDKRALRMFLWTNYYSKQVNAMAARVLGPNEVCGIYKITNIQTQQVYIGQAQNIRERFRQHCKTGGLNIDRPTTNKFYQNMVKYGLSNFTFELLEKCSRAELNEREKYWISFFESDTFGLNSTAGNS